jgi:hypothetical protein
MLNIDETVIDQLIIHYVGNPSKEEGCYTSELIKENLRGDDARTIINQCLKPYKNSTLQYQFTTENDANVQSVSSLAQLMFNQQSNFAFATQSIAQLLFTVSDHPQVKAGNLIIMAFNNLRFNEIIYKGIGIFKSESKTPFLQITQHTNDFELAVAEGILTDNIEKSCLILEGTTEAPMMVLCHNKANNTQAEAIYWKDDFLQIEPAENNFVQTQAFMEMTNSFIKDRYPNDFELNKVDQIDLLNKSVKFLQLKDSFNEDEFANEVLMFPEVKESFAKFTDEYKSSNNLALNNDFEIDNRAVKNYDNNSHKVIKLDKNFHVYVHGNKHLIEKGFDENRDKHFYKIYFDEEN